MKLYLCRHAEAVDLGDGAQLDEDRWLTAHGRSQTALVGRALREADERPGLILTSPLVRAVQTAEGLARALGYTGVIEVRRSLAPEGRLSTLLADATEYAGTHERIFVVGHEPQMSAWSAALLGRSRLARAFEKGAVLRVDWDDEPQPGTGRGAFYLAPERLQREPP